MMFVDYLVIHVVLVAGIFVWDELRIRVLWCRLG